MLKKVVSTKEKSIRKRKADTAPPLAKKEKKPTMKHTAESVLESFSAETKYGQSFRCLDSGEQKKEVDRLNKEAVKGTNEVIKSKMITQKYKQLVADKMREFLIEQRQSISPMFRATPPSRSLALLDPTFISVSEWVEMDADRTPG
jgi:hypothetical protein